MAYAVVVLVVLLSVAVLTYCDERRGDSLSSPDSRLAADGRHGRERPSWRLRQGGA